MNTIEGNKLIAEFMGAKRVDDHPESLSEVVKFDLDTRHIVAVPGNFKFHSSWDWLIPVVRKINKWSISDNLWKNWRTLYRPDIIDALANADINSLWIAVIEFIKWYNKER